MKVKAKPTFNFQSVEFEYELDNDNIDNFKQIYVKLLDILKEVSSDTPQREFNPPTEAQINIMKSHGIKFTKTTSREEAQVLIQQSIKNNRPFK